MLNTVFVHHSSSHHAENSGYARLIDFIPGQVIYGKPVFPFRLWKFVADLHSQKAGIYDAGSMFKFIALYRFLKKHKNQRNVVHFLNGERDIRHLGFLKKRFPNTFFCATFHKPPEILKENITDVSALKKLDGAIAVGTNQVEFLKDWLDLENVVYIPHGVDTDYFKPNEALKERNTLLFVGQHLRDFETFNRTIPELAKVIEDLKVKVVIHPAYVPQLKMHPCIEILAQVRDEELLRLYQKAILLFLPMLDSTACNSILEAMACGLPIITNRVGGNMTYLENTNNILIENQNKGGFIDVTISLLGNSSKLKEMGELSRSKAESLSWGVLVTQLNDFYKHSL